MWGSPSFSIFTSCSYVFTSILTVGTDALPLFWEFYSGGGVICGASMHYDWNSFKLCAHFIGSYCFIANKLYSPPRTEKSLKYVFSCGEKHCPPPLYRAIGPQRRLHCKIIIHICIRAIKHVVKLHLQTIRHTYIRKFNGCLACVHLLLLTVSVYCKDQTTGSCANSAFS